MGVEMHLLLLLIDIIVLCAAVPVLPSPGS